MMTNKVKTTGQNLTLFVDEVAKVGTGGVATEAQAKALGFKNVKTFLAQFEQMATGEPISSDQATMIGSLVDALQHQRESIAAQATKKRQQLGGSFEGYGPRAQGAVNALGGGKTAGKRSVVINGEVLEEQ